MITLKEAFGLCRVKDDEVLYFADSVADANFWSWAMTGQEVRKKYDMRHTMVTAILPHFNFGEYEGFTFVIQKNEGRQG